MFLVASVDDVGFAPEERTPVLEYQKVVCVVLGPFQFVGSHHDASSSLFHFL